MTTGVASNASRQEDGLELFRRMQLVRRFEELVARLFTEGAVPGDVHLSIGQEAVAVGVCSQLESRDWIAASHRAHGVALARGVPLQPLLAELLGRISGLCRGRAGSMHIACAEVGFLGAFPVIGAAPPLVAGAALTAKITRSGGIGVVFIGDGALNHGFTLETLNLAAVWELPMVVVLENNGWAETTPVDDVFRITPLAKRAEGFGLPARVVDGQDVGAVIDAARWAVDGARGGDGPRFVECLTERFRGHYEGDPGGYRSLSDDQVRARDPLVLSATQLGLSEEDVATFERACDDLLAVALARVRGDPEPQPAAELLTDVFAEAR